jgi:tyrosyl-tRNA synthetase
MEIPFAKQLSIIKSGTVDLISENELKEKLQKKLKLRVKYGADPSAPDLHLGHTVPLRKLAVLQELGHVVVFIIGDFTARIGDPSFQSETRRRISSSEIKKNALTYEEQVFRILDRKKTEVRYNSEWFDKFTPEDFLNLTSKYTVARLLERDDFSKRFRDKKPITLLEFLYPLLQGYDSVEVKSDVELGGTDQKFNLLVGRELQRDWNEPPQVVMTLPIIPGTDGKDKMSKSLGNHIAIHDSPKEMYGKVMSLPDNLMESYFQYVSGLSKDEYEPLVKKLIKTDPRELKAQLAERITMLYHDQNRAKKARSEFDRIFKTKGLPDEIETIRISETALDVVSLLKVSGLVNSKGEGRRLVEQGGVRIDQVRVTDPHQKIEVSKKSLLVQCGKRKFARVVCL